MFRHLLRPPYSLLAALLATTATVTAVLGWAGWRLLNQQRAIDQQRLRDQVEQRADALAVGLRSRLADAGDRLGAWLSDPTLPVPAIDRGVVVAVSGSPSGDARGDGPIAIVPAHALPFVPFVSEPSSASRDTFADLESAEFAGGRLADVASRYRSLAAGTDRSVQAGALLRLGRVLRKAGDFAGALDAYRRLARLGSVRTDNLPALLVALDGQRLVAHAMGDAERERAAANELLRRLDDGEWPIDRGTAEFYRDAVSTAPKPESWLLADALSDVWLASEGNLSSRGQRVFGSDGRRVLILWRSTGTRTIALAAPVSTFFEWPSTSLTWQLTAPDGLLLSGLGSPSPGAVTRVIGNSSDNPWTLRVWATSSLVPGTASNQPVILGMMAAVLTFLWAATYFMVRAIRREAAVSQLQSDFVAAVSHEFRTPLTTVRQMAEMLELDRVPTESRRHQYYGILASEAARLQRLVETLLNFGRMEAGAERYRMLELDLSALVGDVAREMEPFAGECAVALEAVPPDGDIRVLADANALSIAVRNLIDNAIKYSPRSSVVTIQCSRKEGDALIDVSDTGPGISPDEERKIFRKFVRGQAATDANIKGTGIGLAMAKYIVTAHGGEIRLNSKPGRGSTFSIVLPVAQPASSAQPIESRDRFHSANANAASTHR